MEAIDPQDVASFDPRGLIGRIYVGTTRLYYIVYTIITCGPHVFRKDFKFFFPL